MLIPFADAIATSPPRCTTLPPIGPGHIEKVRLDHGQSKNNAQVSKTHVCRAPQVLTGRLASFFFYACSTSWPQFSAGAGLSSLPTSAASVSSHSSPQLELDSATERANSEKSKKQCVVNVFPQYVHDRGSGSGHATPCFALCVVPAAAHLLIPSE